MRKLFIIIGIVSLLIIASIFAYNSKTSKQLVGQKQENITRYRDTLTGEYVCLPLKTSGQQAFKCDFGIKTQTNDYYVVDFNLMSQGKPELKPGDRFTATGTITPIEMLNTDYWQKYPVKGIFSITDSARKL